MHFKKFQKFIVFLENLHFKNVLFWSVKVLSCRSSNPTLGDLFFQVHLLSQVHYIGLVIGG